MASATTPEEQPTADCDWQEAGRTQGAAGPDSGGPGGSWGKRRNKGGALCWVYVSKARSRLVLKYILQFWDSFYAF